jgi:hypothetical protein
MASDSQAFVLSGFGIEDGMSAIEHKQPISPQARSGFGVFEDPETSDAPEAVPAQPTQTDHDDAAEIENKHQEDEMTDTQSNEAVDHQEDEHDSK